MVGLSPSEGLSGGGPLFRDVAGAVEAWISAGGVMPGESLPSAAALAEQFACSPHTARRATRLLAQRGIVGGVQGRPPIVLVGARTAGRSRSEQVALELMERITSGALPPGARVPSEAALAAELGVSRATVREGLHRLERTGAVVRRSARRYVAGEGAGSDLAYAVVAAAMRARLAGEWQGVDRLPGESDLAAEYRVSRPTIRRALGLLFDERLVYPVPKSGWFVTPRRTPLRPVRG